MKKYSICLFIFAFLFTAKVSADVIPINTHPINRCVKITNIEEFPDMYFIGYVTGPIPKINGSPAYIIKSDECLTKGYKFNTFQVLAAKKSYIDSIGINNFNPFNKVLKKNTIVLNKESNCYYDSSNKTSPCMDKIESWYEDELSDKNVFLSNNEINLGSGFIDKNNPLIKEEIHYSVSGFSNGKLILEKVKTISEYNNGTPTKIETFPSKIDKKIVNKDSQDKINITEEAKMDPIPQPVKKGFWKSLPCFFVKLLGGSCESR